MSQGILCWEHLASYLIGSNRAQKGKQTMMSSLETHPASLPRTLMALETLYRQRVA